MLLSLNVKSRFKTFDLFTNKLVLIYIQNTGGLLTTDKLLFRYRSVGCLTKNRSKKSPKGRPKIKYTRLKSCPNCSLLFSLLVHKKNPILLRNPNFTSQKVINKSKIPFSPF